VSGFGAEPPRSDRAEPERSDGAEPPRSDGAEPPRSDGAEPERSDGAEPERSDGAEPERSDGAEPERSEGDELSRLDPDAAAALGADQRSRRRADVAPEPSASAGGDLPPPRAAFAPAPVVDTRRYQRMIGLIGLALVAAFSVYLLVNHHASSTTGVAAGHRLRWFAAPLATTDLRGAANLHPPCTFAAHDPRALNLCIDAGRGPIVLSLFVLGGGPCERQVDALQTLSHRFAGSSVQFLAVALNASHTATATAVRAHHWTIPVAYDEDGRVGEQYGVVACPMVELARRGGIVVDRLIGNPWDSAAALAPRVRALLAGAAR
jgi:peroxiredoxin